MDAIDTFLDAMFAPYPATPRLTEAKAELRAMMEDAYGDAIAAGMTHNEAVGKVITDFGNLEELAPVLGIETELRPADAAGTAGQSGPTLAAAAGPSPTLSPAPGSYPPVTLPEAQALAEARRTTSRLLGAGVAVLALAATPLLVALGLSNEGTGILNVSQDTALSVALPFTLIIVAVGVGIFIRRSRAFVELRHLTEGRFTRNPQVSAWASRLRSDNEGPRSRALAVAVGLWVCSAIPAIALSGPLGRGHTSLSPFGAAGCLALVALGLYIFLPTNWASSTYSTLTQEGHALPSSPGYATERGNRIIGVIASVYWPVAALIYVVWGFIFDGWGASWILWPIGGVLFGVVAVIVNAVSASRQDATGR